MIMKNKEKQDVGIGKIIKEARLNVGISSIKVSQKLGLSDSICSQWERGNANPSTAHLAKLAKILGVSFEWLALGKIENEVEQNDLQNLFNRQSPTSQKYLTKFVASVV
jgi:transcriptional regulator with XRE-family HTH domain